MTRREWLLIAHAMKELRREIETESYPEDPRTADYLSVVNDASFILADAIDKYESEPSDRWLRRHPDEPPENYRSAFDKARFLQECGL